MFIADDNALFLGSGDGHVHSAAVGHEPRKSVADSTTADGRNDDHISVGSLAGVHLFVWDQ